MAEIIARNDNELNDPGNHKTDRQFNGDGNTILDSCNEIGCLATTEAFEKI